MSKCRPESGLEFAAIAEFLRSVHVNGVPLRLPDKIDEIHTHPRLALEMADTLHTDAFKRRAIAFDAAEIATEQIQRGLHDKLATLDKRLDEILNRLGTSPPKP